MMLNKHLLTIWLIFFLPVIILSQPPAPQSYKQNGIERTIRQGNNWDWGTHGHGSFAAAAELFEAEKEISVYEEGRFTYRVFTAGNTNYVEMNTGWNGGIFTYTTDVGSETRIAKLPDSNETKQIVTDDIKNKVIRRDGNWSWGNFDHGSFDQTVAILKEEGNVIKFTDPYNDKIKYRVFSHGSLNFVEIDYGWEGGKFAYTTNR